jgi:hypothetical protein
MASVSKRNPVTRDGTHGISLRGTSTKRTPERRALILEALAQGATHQDCADLVGIEASTLRTWTRDDPEFYRECNAARAKMKVMMLAIIQKAAVEWKQWQAAAWKLERIFPEEFGRRWQPMPMVKDDASGETAGKVYRVVVEPRPTKAQTLAAVDGGLLAEPEGPPDTSPAPEGVLETAESGIPEGLPSDKD